MSIRRILTKPISIFVIGALFGVLLTTILFSIATRDSGLIAWASDFARNIGAVMIGVVLIFFLIGLIEGNRGTSAFQKFLIKNARSKDKSIARNAVRELRDQGWLAGKHGVLQTMELDFADLQGTDLSHANLHQSTLRFANLSHCDFRHTDMTGANLVYANLQGARFLANATFDEHTVLPDAKQYQGDGEENDNTVYHYKYWTAGHNWAEYITGEIYQNFDDEWKRRMGWVEPDIWKKQNDWWGIIEWDNRRQA